MRAPRAPGSVIGCVRWNSTTRSFARARRPGISSARIAVAIGAKSSCGTIATTLFASRSVPCAISATYNETSSFASRARRASSVSLKPVWTSISMSRSANCVVPISLNIKSRVRLGIPSVGNASSADRCNAPSVPTVTRPASRASSSAASPRLQVARQSRQEGQPCGANRAMTGADRARAPTAPAESAFDRGRGTTGYG